jgi:hypothetical protein
LPEVGRPSWCKTAIDRFVLARLEAEGIEPAEEADKPTLIRRVHYDLLGLPPSPEDVAAFLGDSQPGSYERMVDRALGSSHFGERWGRHWLDAARYADSDGYEKDNPRPDAWRYRDWVIDSFNLDKPYDRFIREQLAGDEVAPEDPVANTGTGYFCVGPNRDLFPDQADINRVETLTDYVDTTASVFLGLTAGCARCHDHKYDPIPQRDYFRMQAIFAPGIKVPVALSRLDSLGWLRRQNVNEIKLQELGYRVQAAQARCRSSNKSREDVRACLSPEESAQLRAAEKQLLNMFGDYKPKPFACGFTDIGDYAPKTFVPAKGGGKGEEVQPGFFTALGGGDIPAQSFERPTTGPIPLFPTTGRRKALAEWLSSKDNPLTARVMVNRIWQYHFGRGLVGTTSNFGARGDKPTHPELLDWLALEFAGRGWSVKDMHRLILMSAAYRQSSQATPAASGRDPENLWLSHFRRRRLDAEELRDAILAATGELNPKRGGRPVVPALTEEELFNLIGRPEEQWIVTTDPAEHNRRSVYLFQKRTFRLPMMEVFDSPDSMLTCSRRDSSTTAPQSLTLLNGAFLTRLAGRLASRIAPEPGDGELIRKAWLSVLARPPAPAELATAVRFLAKQTTQTGGRQPAAMELVRALLNTNEFLYID